MPRLALVSYPVLLFCTVLPPCFILLRCFFCRLVLFRCGAFLLPRFTLLRCLFCRLVLLRCSAFFAASFYFAAVPFLPLRFTSLQCLVLPPRFTSLRCLFCRFVLLRCSALSCRLVLLRCGALSCRFALLRCPASSCRFDLPRYHARLTALSCCLALPPYLSPPSCLSYRLAWFCCLAPFYDLASSILTPLRLFFHLKKTIFRTLCPSPFPFCAVP